jgi:Tfp pilus assembly protein PilE
MAIDPQTCIGPKLPERKSSTSKHTRSNTMTSQQAPTETPAATQEKPKHPLQQNVTASMMATILVVAVLSPIAKHQFREFFKTNHINNQLKELLQVPAFSALKKADPTVYGQIEKDLTVSLQADEPSDNQKKIIATALSKALPKYAAQASDDALINWTKSLQKAVFQDPQACKAQIETGTAINLDSQANQELMAATGGLVESGAMGQKPAPIDSTRIEQGLSTVRSNITAIHGDRTALLADSKTMKQDPQKSCAMLNDFYAEIAKLPKPEGGAILRNIFGKQAS